jgi:hypothetical protein
MIEEIANDDAHTGQRPLELLKPAELAAVSFYGVGKGGKAPWLTLDADEYGMDVSYFEKHFLLI